MMTETKGKQILDDYSASNNNINNNYSLYYNDYTNNILLRYGIHVLFKLTSTLQGSIYAGIDDIYGNCIIKRCDINLHEKKLGIIKNEIVNVSEDIIKEVNIMTYLHKSHKKPKGVLNVYHFLYDNNNMYFIMEHGGLSLYDHCQEYHKLILNGKLKVKEWIIHVKILFKQLINIIFWLHNEIKLCHMDISLENILIKGYEYNIKSNKFIKHGQVYLCDFALSETFKNNDNFLCNKYVGKSLYQCPEIIYKQKMYDARLQDTWSLGVCLFMMVIGNQPMMKAHESDIFFIHIINGKLKHLLLKGNKQEYINDHFIDLLNHIFCLNSRYYITDIIKHSFMK